MRSVLIPRRRGARAAGAGAGAVALVLAAAALAGCGDDDPSVTAAQAGRPVVVTALRPLAEAAERVAGRAAVVIDLVPVGESAHELDLTDRQRQEVLDADLAIVVGKGYQVDLEEAAAAREGPTLDVLASLGLPDRPDGSAGPPDPHVWLDPTIMGSIVTAVAGAIAGVAPDDAAAIAARAEAIVEDLVRLDAVIASALTGCDRTLLVTQHESFGWFAARYGLRTLAFDGVLPDDDPAPDPERVAAVLPFLTDGSVTSLFVETLFPTSWIEVLAEEHGLETPVLNPYEGLTAREATDGATYRSILLYNMRALVDHLDCEGGA